MKFRLVNNHIIVSINGLNYLVDTGATNSSSYSGYKRYNIDGEDYIIYGIDGGNVKDVMEILIGTELDGIIGLDILTKNGFTIDYGNNNLLLHVDNGEQYESIPFILDNGHIKMKGFIINGRECSGVTLDTGAYKNVCNRELLREEDMTTQPFEDYNPSVGKFAGYLYNVYLNGNGKDRCILVEPFDESFCNITGYHLFLNPKVFTEKKIVVDFENNLIKYEK